MFWNKHNLCSNCSKPQTPYRTNEVNISDKMLSSLGTIRSIANKHKTSVKSLKTISFVLGVAMILSYCHCLKPILLGCGIIIGILVFGYAALWFATEGLTYIGQFLCRVFSGTPAGDGSAWFIGLMSIVFPIMGYLLGAYLLQTPDNLGVSLTRSLKDLNTPSVHSEQH